MALDPEKAVVRIFDKYRKVVGSGAYIGPRWVVTCAHVVQAACGISGDEIPNLEEIKDKEICLDFPMVALSRKISSRIKIWEKAEDIAGLELKEDPPESAKTVVLVNLKNLKGHPFSVLGFPPGQEDMGMNVKGLLSGRLADGRIQMDGTTDPTYWVKPGFSGTPVWDETLKEVVGIVVASERDERLKVAAFIPNEAIIKAWPDIEAELPKVIRTLPENESIGVPCDLDSVEITFSRPMQNGHSITSPIFKIAEIVHQPEPNTFILKRAADRILPHDTKITLVINPSDYGPNFRDENGLPSPSDQMVVFKTGPCSDTSYPSALVNSIDKIALLNSMTNAFDRQEINIICKMVEGNLKKDGKQLKLSLEIVSGNSARLDTQILDLIEYLGNRGYLSYLIKSIRERYPDFSW